MSLTKYIIDLGKPVAYFPNLKKVTKSTTASLLLCQLIYWCDKTRDSGWIWKNSNELEQETGLSYNEQRTARKNLVEDGLIEEVEEKLKHRMKFRVNEKRLNELWEQSGAAVEIQKSTSVPYSTPPKTPVEQKPVEVVVKSEPVIEKLIEPPQVSATVEVPTLGTKFKQIFDIKELLRKKFHINPSGYKWDTFCEYVYNRETQYGEKLDVFIKWGLANGYDPRFWTAEKMTTLYPQAFITKEEQTSEDDGFINLMPQISKDKKSVPMPKDMRVSNDW